MSTAHSGFIAGSIETSPPTSTFDATTWLIPALLPAQLKPALGMWSTLTCLWLIPALLPAQLKQLLNLY